MTYNVAVLGAGNIGKAKSAYLASKGFNVNLYNRSINRIEPLLKTREISFTGVIEGKGILNKVTTNIYEAIEGTDIILITTPALYHLDITRDIAPLLKSNHIILLFSGKFGGSVLIDKAIKDINPLFDGTVIEATSVVSSRLNPDGKIWIRGIKQKVRFASINFTKTMQATPVVISLFESMTPTDSFLKRSFYDIGSILHVPTFLSNLPRIDQAEDFYFYKQGVTNKVADLIEILDAERSNIAKAYNINSISLMDIIKEYYATPGDSLFEVIHNNETYMISKAPKGLYHRYILEELSESLVPMYKMGLYKGVKTPLMRSYIDFASVLYQYPFMEKGRDLTFICDNEYLHV